MPFFRFSRQLGTRAFSRLFSRPLCMLLLSRICCYSPELSVFSVTKMKSDIVYARAQVAILRSSGHSGKEIAKYFNKMVRWYFVHSKVLHERTGVFRGQLSYYPVECPHLLPPGYPASYPNTAISSFNASFLLAI